MPNPFHNCLGEYAARIGVQRPDTMNSAAHRASIKQKLESHYGTFGFFRSGSFGNGTSVSGHSDVDYFAVIDPRRLETNSSQVLARMAALLRERFPMTGVRVDEPGVRLPFGSDGDELTEIIPVRATGMTTAGFRRFDMPDGNGGWMFSAPESHNAYVSETDQSLSWRLKPLIRLVKAWNYSHDVKIRSFYLEMFVTRWATNEKVIVYDIDLANIFRSLRSTGLPSIIDPRFPNDGRLIEPCKTAAQWMNAYHCVGKAAELAMAARMAHHNGDNQQSYQLWDRLFSRDLPPLRT